jgi:hypothetical protein
MASKTSHTSIRPTVVVASSSTSKGKIIPISSYELNWKEHRICILFFFKIKWGEKI